MMYFYLECLSCFLFECNQANVPEYIKVKLENDGLVILQMYRYLSKLGSSNVSSNSSRVFIVQSIGSQLGPLSKVQRMHRRVSQVISVRVRLRQSTFFFNQSINRLLHKMLENKHTKAIKYPRSQHGKMLSLLHNGCKMYYFTRQCLQMFHQST